MELLNHVQVESLLKLYPPLHGYIEKYGMPLPNFLYPIDQNFEENSHGLMYVLDKLGN